MPPVPFDDSIAGPPQAWPPQAWGDAPAPIAVDPNGQPAPFAAGGPPPSDWNPVPGMGVPQEALQPAIDAAGQPVAPPLFDALASGAGDAAHRLGTALGYEQDVPKATEMHALEAPPQPVLPPSVVGPDNVKATDDIRGGLKLADVAERDPELYTAINAQNEAAQAHRMATAQVADAEDQHRQAQSSFDAYKASQAKAQAATQQLMTDAAALGNQKIDPDRWYGSRSTAGKIGAWVAAIAGGLNSPNTGGKNMGLEQINKSIDNDIEAQKATLNNQHQALGMRQSAIGQLYAQSGNMYQAQETFRVAAHEQVIRKLQAEQGLYDPNGTTARHIAGAIVEQRAQQARIINEFGGATHKRELEDKEFALKKARDAADQKSKQRELDISGYSASIHNKEVEYGHADKKAEQAAKDKENADKVSDPGEISGIPTAVKDVVGKTVGVTNGVVMNGDGKPYRAPEKLREPLRKSMLDTKNLIDSIDAARTIRNRSGWSSAATDGDDYAKLHSEFAQAVLDIKNHEGISRFSDTDKDQFEHVLGNVSDPTRYRDIEAGLTEARKIAVRSLNNQFSTSPGFNGPKIEFPDLPAASGEVNRRDSDEEMKHQAGWLTDSYSFGKDPSVVARNLNAQGRPVSDAAIAEQSRGYTNGQQNYVDGFAIQMNSKDAKVRASAETRLRAIADSASSPGLKSYASLLLADPKAAQPEPFK